MLSRAIGIYQIPVYGGNAPGSLLCGAIAGASGMPAALITCAAIMVVGAGFGLLLRIQELDVAGLDPNLGWIAPVPKIDMTIGSGPMLTTIAYKIREEDVPKFLATMQEKRRNRIRDGAKR